MVNGLNAIRRVNKKEDGYLPSQKKMVENHAIQNGMLVKPENARLIANGVNGKNMENARMVLRDDLEKLVISNALYP